MIIIANALFASPVGITAEESKATGFSATADKRIRLIKDQMIVLLDNMMITPGEINKYLSKLIMGDMAKVLLA